MIPEKLGPQTIVFAGLCQRKSSTNIIQAIALDFVSMEYSIIIYVRLYYIRKGSNI